MSSCPPPSTVAACAAAPLPSWADPCVDRWLGKVAGPHAVEGDGLDPQVWLFRERSRFLSTGLCDPWAEHLLRRAGLLPNR